MENYKKLLSKIDEYKETKIWEYITGEDIFKITGYDKNVYVSIMGNSKMDYGIVIFNNDEELFSQLDGIFGEYQHFPDMYNRFTFFKIQLFDTGNILNPKDKSKLIKNKIKSNDHIFKLEAGYLPRIVNEDEAKFIIDVLEKIILISKHIIAEKIKMTEKDFLKKMYDFNIENNLVKHSKINFPNKKILHLPKDELDSSKVNKLISTKKTGTYHIGLFYAPVFIKDKKKDYYPFLLLVVDKRTQFILGINLIKKEEINSVPNKLMDLFINSNIVPENICFSDNATLELCREVLIKFNIKYNVNNKDELLFRIWNQVASQMVG